MTTQISSTNIQPATLAVLAPVSITSITVTNSSWTPLDDSAVSTSGGYIVITGTNFATGCNVIISSTNATSVAFVNSTTLRVQVPAMSAGTYVVYVVNTNGSTAIIVNGLTYSGTPTWVTASPLPQGVTSIPISIQLSATGDTPLTYALQAGSTLPSGLTLSSSGLLSGTVTGLTSDTTYNFTIEAIDPQLQDSPKAFAITIVAGDQFWDYVTLLLPGTTSTSIFNDDASTNNFNISVFGDARPNNFGPYTPGYYSNFFDGTGDYLTVADTTNIRPESGNCTWEAWVYPLSLPSSGNFKTFWAQRATATLSTDVGGACIVMDSSGNYLYFIANSAANSWQVSGASTGFTVLLNQWQHIALVRSGNTMTFYRNGVAGTTASVATGAIGTSGNLSLMAGAANGVQAVDGYMSNFRFVKGTAVYTSNFTPSTIPLTNITGTSLLTCQSNRFIDNSTNNFAITRNGDVRIDGFDPFVIPSSIGVPNLYSGYFDGTGDFLTIPNNAAFNISANFTIEMWIYPTALSGVKGLFGQRASEANYAPILMEFNGATLQFLVSTSGSSWAVNLSSPSLTVNTWTHIALVRSGTTVSYYINGVAGGSTGTATGALMSPVAPIYIGADAGTPSGAGYFPGYISNFRIVNGTAVYTSNFTPPTQPLTAISGTSLLTCQNSTLIDNSTNNFAITSVGQAQPVAVTPFTQTFTSQTITGTGSTYFDGTGDYLSIADNSAFQITGDFTVEAWVYQFSSKTVTVIGQWPSSATTSFIFRIENTGQLSIAYNISGETNGTLSTSRIVYNTWNHVVWTRSGTTFRYFINGIQDATTFSLSGAFADSAGSILVGLYNTTVDTYFNGYISNARFVKGTALYTANFTPPTQPLTSVTNTSLLTCQTNQPNNNNMFLDSSTNNFLVTRNGNTTQGTFSPYAENWSNYFDGNGDNLTVTAPALTGIWTVEFWVYQTAAGGVEGAGYVYNGNTGSNANRVMISRGPSGEIYFYSESTSPTNYAVSSANGVIALNTWYHIAVVSNNSTIKIYVNGVEVASGSITNTPASGTTLNIGFIRSAGALQYFTGYISNFRYTRAAVYTSAFTPSTTPLLPIANTSLLTCRDSTIVDDSANRLAITVVGNTSVQKFGPFAGTTLPTPYYSAYFDGTGDFLTLSSAPVAATGTFTVECWVYVTGTAAAQSIYGQYLGNPSPAAGRWSMLWNDAANKFSFSIAATSYASASTYSANTWYHIAWVRDGSNNLSLYVNGVRDSITAGVSTSLYTGNPIIGARSDGTTPYTGYISNFRVTNTVVYSGTTYIVPTTPLTAISGTTVLTCQSPTFIDNSTNQLTITAAGNSQPSFFNPFTVTYSILQSYSPSVFGGSMYFDGTGDYLTLADNAAWTIDSNYTIEFWAYAISFPGAFNQIVSQRSSSTVYWSVNWNTTNGWTFLYNNGSGEVSFTRNQNSPLNQWVHVAVVKSGTTGYIFLNGQQAGATFTFPNIADNSSLLFIGAWPLLVDYFNGYISNLRMVKGTALYTSNFVPSNQPLTAVQNSVLLLNGTGAGIYDASAQNNLETVGDSRLVTNTAKYGNTSMFFDGTGDYLLSPSSPAFDFPSNFTIEMWINFTNVNSTWQSIISRAYGIAGGWRLYKNDGNNQLRWYSNLTSVVLTTGSTLANNTWSHIAVVRNSGTVTIYIDGVNRGSAVNATSYTPGNYALEIGSGVVTSAFPMTGNINDLRITQGVARYTANFTPPTIPFLTN